MNFFELIKNALIDYIFLDLNFYNEYIGTMETFQTQLISFTIDFLAFSIPLFLIVLIFAIPLYFILKAFNKVIKTMRTNVYVEEERESRFKRKK